MRYELATLSTRPGGVPALIEGVRTYTASPEAGGELLGVFITEIGQLNQVIVLRGFEDDAALNAERLRLLGTANPFNAGAGLTAMSLDSYRPFPFLPPVRPGKFGGIYEIRTYAMKLGGIEATAAIWEKTLAARLALSPLTIAMTTLDGPPRFTHIWPYANLEARGAIRAEAMAKGIWPPKGGPDWLTGDMRSTIAIPAPISPLA
ncbi:NIPSNAP family protein [Acetobacteraceae bacterium H6797]|nr:NIPSNAP family protein [Acetobacteraceae bacterium H6797]